MCILFAKFILFGLIPLIGIIFVYQLIKISNEDKEISKEYNIDLLM